MNMPMGNGEWGMGNVRTQSAIRNPQSEISNPKSAIRNPQSEILSALLVIAAFASSAFGQASYPMLMELNPMAVQAGGSASEHCRCDRCGHG